MACIATAISTTSWIRTSFSSLSIESEEGLYTKTQKLSKTLKRISAQLSICLRYSIFLTVNPQPKLWTYLPKGFKTTVSVGFQYCKCNTLWAAKT